MPTEYRIFLLTDDERYLAYLKGLYGERVIATDCQRTSTAVGTHYLPSVDPFKAGREVVGDVYLALRADQFIGSGGSNVSALIALMKRWAPGNCVLIGESVLAVRHLSVYLARGQAARPASRTAAFLTAVGAIFTHIGGWLGRIRAALTAIRGNARFAPANVSSKVIVNVYKDTGLWKTPPPGIGDYLRGCAFLFYASCKGPFAGRFMPRVNLDLSPGAKFLQKSKYHCAAERSDLLSAREFFLSPRDGDLLQAIEEFLQSDDHRQSVR